MISDFHQNKDWNNEFPSEFFSISLNLISDFHQNKDWNWQPNKSEIKLKLIWFLISTKTRIETFSQTSSLIPSAHLISDFHQNKDWNLVDRYCVLLGVKFDFWFPPKQGLKQSKKANHYFGLFLFDFWFPPKQGLKQIRKVYLAAERTIWFLISTKTRIETSFLLRFTLYTYNLISDFHQNKDWNLGVKVFRLVFVGIWFLISTKTRIETTTWHSLGCW